MGIILKKYLNKYDVKLWADIIRLSREPKAGFCETVTKLRAP